MPDDLSRATASPDAPGAVNPDYVAVVSESFARQTFMATLGAELVAVRPGEVEIRVPYRAQHAQQNGFLHAGVVTSVADSACGYAALSLAPAGYDVLTVEFKVNLIRPAAAPEFLAFGRVLRAGRSLTTCAGEVFGETPTGRVLVAAILATVIARPAV